LLVKNLPLKYKNFAAPLTIFFMALIVSLFAQQLTDVLIYDNQLIQHGDFWRILTGHFLHTNNVHLLLNSAAIILLWALHGQFYTIKSYLFVFIFCALVTSFGLYFYSPELIRYVGLSGILHGIFIWGACLDIKNKDKTGYLLLFGAIIKILHEQIFGASKEVAELINANVAIDAHLWGAIAGLIAFLLINLVNNYRVTRE